MSTQTPKPPAANHHLPQYPRAAWAPHAHFWNGRSHHNIRYVILHAFPWPGANPTAQDVAKLYQKSKAKIGPHFIVDRAGGVVQCVREEDAAWSNGEISAGADTWWGPRGNPNLETLSVEVIKTRGDNSDSITYAQREATFMLITYLVRKWRIPARWADGGGGITGHFSIDPIHYKYCPGPFPWDELFHALIAPGDSPMSQPYGSVREPVIGSGNVQPSEPTATPPYATGSGEPTGGTVAARTHTALQEAPGFAGIVKATDTAEAFQPLTITTLSDIPNWLATNGLALLVRLLLIGLGLGLIGALLFSLVRRNSWMGKAGGDLIPLAFANASATGDQAGGEA